MKKLKSDKNNSIGYEFSIPYYHQSNGRIERANRSTRNALRKTKGNYKFVLKNVVENYNNIIHRALGTSPNEALKKENHDKIKEHQIKYKKEFIDKNKIEKLEKGDAVLIRRR